MISFEGKTIEQVLDEIGQEFQHLSPERQEEVRKNLYEGLTGQPYPPPPAPEEKPPSA